MIDIHNHILPGVDDGPWSVETAVQLARQASAQGITHVIATPHHRSGHFYHPFQDVAESVQRFNECLASLEIPLRIETGQEVHVHAGLLDELDSGAVQCLANGRYLLIEFPQHLVERGAAMLISRLLERGITPIIAHPERNAFFKHKPAALEQLIALGAWGQLTAASITGERGKEVQRTALRFCEHQLIHVVASDAHCPTRRPFRLTEGFTAIRRLLGEQAAAYYKDNADLVLGRTQKQSEQELTSKLRGGAYELGTQRLGPLN